VCALECKGGGGARAEVGDFQGASDQLSVQRLLRKSVHSHVEPWHRWYCAHDKSRVHRSGVFVTGFRGLGIAALGVCVFLFFIRERVHAAHDTAQAPPEASNHHPPLFQGEKLDRDGLARSRLQRHLLLLSLYPIVLILVVVVVVVYRMEPQLQLLQPQRFRL
jgi:hypothetical protein